MKIFFTIFFLGVSSVYANDEALPCLERYLSFVPSGTVLSGVTDDGKACTVTSNFYPEAKSMQVAIFSQKVQISSNFGTNYQYRKVKCELHHSGLLLDSTWKDDEDYSTAQRTVLSLTLSNSTLLRRIELSKPRLFGSKKAACTVTN